MIGAFIGFGVLTVFGGASNLSIPIPLVIVLMFLAAMVGCSILGITIERFAYRPLRDAPRIAPLISALGVSFFLQNSALLLFSGNFRSYDSFSLYDGRLFLPLTLGPLKISPMRLLVIGSALAFMVALTLLVGRTQAGRAMRATSHDREAAAMMGIDVDRVIVVTFLLGSALAGAAGVMTGLVFERVYHTMGFLAGLKGFAAAVVGGIGSIPGAMVGGLVIGLAESFSIAYVLVDVLGPGRLRDPDRRHARATDGPARQGGHQEGLMSEPEPGQPQIGVDEWVATADARERERSWSASGTCGAGFRARPRSRSLRQSSSRSSRAHPRADVGSVHPAGLGRHADLRAARPRSQRRRRLGGIARPRVRRLLRNRRAYSYALLSSDQFGIHWEAQFTGAAHRCGDGARGSLAGPDVVASPRRLPGDRHALLPAGVRRRHDERQQHQLPRPDADDRSSRAGRTG